MNTAQLANNILAAWKYQDRSGLGTAIDNALTSCKTGSSTSGVESEREEMLQCIAERLRTLANRDELPVASKGSGALALLSHLSAYPPAESVTYGENQSFPGKTLNLPSKSSKCVEEADCRPRA